jgi:aryl-alcohol dehydrogenase-like predicted oxidoreductase
MKYTFLPSTNIKVSKICLGTMTFGNQNSEQEGFEQMDYAIETGVNFSILLNFILFLQLQHYMQIPKK